MYRMQGVLHEDASVPAFQCLHLLFSYNLPTRVSHIFHYTCNHSQTINHSLSLLPYTNIYLSLSFNFFQMYSLTNLPALRAETLANPREVFHQHDGDFLTK